MDTTGLMIGKRSATVCSSIKDDLSAQLTCRSFGLESCPLAFFALVAFRFGLLHFDVNGDGGESIRYICIESDSARTCCRLA